MNTKESRMIIAFLVTVVLICSCSIETSANSIVESNQTFEQRDETYGGCRRSIDASKTVAGKIADSLMTRYPEYMTYEREVVKKGWEYNNSIVLTGFDKLYQAARDTKYLDYIKPYVDTYVQSDGAILYLMGDGVSTRDPRIQDVIHPSNLLFNLYWEHQHPRRAAPHRCREHHSRAWKRPRSPQHRRRPTPEDSADCSPSSQYLAAMINTRNIFPSIQTTTQGGFWHKPNYPYEMWLDGLYMSEPFITKYGALHAPWSDKEACFDTAAYQIKLIAEKTYVPEKGLYCHGWLDWEGILAYNEANPDAPYPIKEWANPVSGQSPEIWGRALGWYSMAVVDVLEYLPRESEDYEDIVEILTTIAEELEKYQDPETGLFYQVIDKGTEPGNYLETSCSAMFAYTLGKAVRKRLIPGRYYVVARKAWEGVKSRTTFNDDGTFTITGGVGGMGILNDYDAYINKLPKDNVPHVVAAVMYASTVMEFW